MNTNEWVQDSGVFPEAKARWVSVARNPDRRLLRLSLLRDLDGALHCGSSELLATGSSRAELPATLAKLEASLGQAWVVSLELELLDWDALLERLSRGAPSSTNTIDQNRVPAWDAGIPRDIGERLARPDRRWERALVSEAAARGWRFGWLESEVEIHQVEEWSSRLSTALWPVGLTLLVESDGRIRYSPDRSDSAFWHGRWLLAWKPGSREIATLLTAVRSWSDTGALGQVRLEELASGSGT